MKDKTETFDFSRLQNGKSIKIRHFRRNYYRDKEIYIWKRNGEDEAIKELVPENVQISQSNFSRITFSEPALINERKFFEEEIKESGADFFLDIYSNEPYFPHTYAPLLYGIWGIAHFASLGLIPLYFPLHDRHEAKLYDRNGDLIKHVKASTRAGKLYWSPLVFRKDSKPFRYRHEDDVLKDNVRKVLNKVFDEKFSFQNKLK